MSQAQGEGVLQVPSGAGKKLQSERAMRELRARILAGELPADSHISETAAAGMLGISRTPTREALAQLVEEGLLDRTSSGRCTVRALSREDVLDAIELRGVLEGTVVRLAAERGAEPGALTRCREIVHAIDGAIGATEADTDFERYVALNGEFHATLARLAGSALLQREAARAAKLPLASPNAFLQRREHLNAVRRSLLAAQAQHRAILDAVARREGARAEALAREHARLARENLDVLMRSDGRIAEGIPGLSLVAGAPTSSMKGRTQ